MSVNSQAARISKRRSPRQLNSQRQRRTVVLRSTIEDSSGVFMGLCILRSGFQGLKQVRLSLSIAVGFGSGATAEASAVPGPVPRRARRSVHAVAAGFPAAPPAVAAGTAYPAGPACASARAYDRY